MYVCIRWGLYIHPWEGALSRGWRWDFPTRRRALFPVALTSVFPCMLLTSVLIGQLPKQSNVTLNFPNKKFLPCDAASRQNPLTTCSSWHFYDMQILFLCLFRTSLLLLSVRALPTPFSFLTRRVTADCSGSPWKNVWESLEQVYCTLDALPFAKPSVSELFLWHCWVELHVCSCVLTWPLFACV